MKSNVSGGNAYGGAVSLYMGAYSSMSSHGNAVAAVGDTVVRNVSVLLDSIHFDSCAAMRESRIKNNNFLGANVYGGSFSFYVGAYAWSQSVLKSTHYGSSNSTCGSINGSNLIVQVKNITSLHARASAISSLSLSYGANSYGGSMSVMYVGGYAFSRSFDGLSQSSCGVSGLSNILIDVSGFTCFNCSAISKTSTRNSVGANSYGGSMSVLYVGAYSWSYCDAAFTSCLSTCGATLASEISVHVSDFTCSNCSSASIIGGKFSNGANSYGGSISVLYIGAYSWSWSDNVSSSSTSLCEDTTSSGVSIYLNGFACFNCSATSISEGSSNGANVYGGSMNVFFIGAYSFCYAAGAEKVFARSIIRATLIYHILITINNSKMDDSLALSGQLISLSNACEFP